MRRSERPCQFTAGTYQTYGRWAFLPGLTMYIPDGWNSTEQDAGEFNLLNPDFPDGSGLFFWRDVIPVEPDGTHITTVPSTVAGITSWLSGQPPAPGVRPDGGGHRQGPGHHDLAWSTWQTER